jgi:hypothetical protein
VPKPASSGESTQQQGGVAAADRTQLLQQYVLSLALTVAKATPNLNLREGCNLRVASDDHWSIIRHRKDDEPISVPDVTAFAKEAMERFFRAMGVAPDGKDRCDVVFQKGVAEEFLGLADARGKPSSTERDKVRALGPVTRATLDKYWADRRRREKSGDPKEKLRTLIDKVRVTPGGKKLNAAADQLRKYLSENPDEQGELKAIYDRISGILDGPDEAKAKVAALKAVLAPASDESVDRTDASPPADTQ